MKSSYDLCRESAALIDLDTEGRFLVTGATAQAALDELVSVDLSRLRPWRGISALFLAEDASIVAIATVFRVDGGFQVFTEAAAAERLHDHLAQALAARGATLVDQRRSHAWIATLGPVAQDVMISAASDDIVGLPYLSAEANALLRGTIFRMGSTGEFEYRVLVPAEHAEAAWSALEAAGRPFGIARVGAEVLDALQLEMRSLVARDIPAGYSPIEAGLHWMVHFGKAHLAAAEALTVARQAPRARCVSVMFDEGSPAPAANSRLYIGERDVGVLASVQFSHTLGRSVGVAYIEPEFGWVGVSFVARTADGQAVARAVSAPMFVTRTAKGASA
ncbi:aminomethyltransferase family protein [Ideonella sp. 4Y11]|uniref:Aminomethyltransferase family protein n=1 Tax=Ideonella aquatica TaxID=2824119 RepID=A0A940YER6_9BURK|nr:aminomethyltransferase family protein [Ideonella aquatica]MBQ0957954.1 aminomethyltransferase family protein [Ideonella aquatica]